MGAALSRAHVAFLTRWTSSLTCTIEVISSVGGVFGGSNLLRVVEWLFAPRKTSIVDTTDRHGALGKDFAHPETVDGLSLSWMKGKATLLFHSFMEASESRIGGPECCAYPHPCFISPSQFVTYNKVIRYVRLHFATRMCNPGLFDTREVRAAVFPLLLLTALSEVLCL